MQIKLQIHRKGEDNGVGTRTNTAGNVTYTRNALGQIITAQSPEVTYNYTYYETHRLESVTDSRGSKKLSYTYSPGGLLNWVTDSDGNETDYLYDKVGRLSAIWAANYDTVTFKYDPGGRLTEKWFPNGITARYNYNADNTLSQVVNRTNASAIISQHDYTYDGVGNRLTHTEKVSATTTSYSYLYDTLNRLTQVGNGTAAQQENYGYDPLNNRTTKTVNATTPTVTAYVYDAANQLKEIRQGSPTGTLLASMLYDDNGNMYQKTEGATTTTLTYNALNRLAQVAKTGIATQTYAYDAQGRRIAKTISGNTTTNYLYNGPDIYGEYASWTTPTAIYTHGPNTDDPIIRATATAAQYFHQDGLGSVVALSNTSGGTDGTQRFDAWGNKLASTGTIPVYGYTGREPDETGLIYYRARYLDPAIGRFTQRDPVGLRGGLNQYLYVGGNPVNWVDPSGLIFKGYNPNTETPKINYVSELQSGMTSGTQSLSNTTGGLPDLDSFVQNERTLVAGGSKAIPPVGDARITTEFGVQDKSHPRPHTGVDYAVPIGTEVVAPFSGTVTPDTRNLSGYGSAVAIEHPNPLGTTILGHNSEVLVKPGDKVEAGDPVALSGNTGRSTGPHVHWEEHSAGPIWGANGKINRGNLLNPLDYLK